MSFFFFFNDTATTEIYTLSLHDALPIYECVGHGGLTDPRLPGDENDLPFALARHPFETPVKLGERVITSDQILRGTRRRRATCRRALRDGGDEPVPSPGHRLDEDGLPGVVSEHRSNGSDVALQHLRLNVSLRPQCFEQLFVRHQSAGVPDEIPQHIKSLRRQENA